MSGPARITRMSIHCDACHHEFEGMPDEWLGLPCPKCGAVMITELDVSVQHMIEAMVELSNATFPDAQENEMVSVHFDTAPKP